MTIENNIFKKFSPDFNKLIDFGFVENNGKYTYTKTFMNNKFNAQIVVTKSGKVCGKIFDIENNDEYLPFRLNFQEGSFVGKVREEYINILDTIKQECFTEKLFIYPQSNRITGLILERFGDKPLFLWEDAPTCGVFKNPESNKWYGIIMNINRTKLGNFAPEDIEVMNIKLEPDEIQSLLKEKGFFPAWHMNKKSWITITLDNTLSDTKIMKYIEKSHNYTIKKQKIKD